MDNDLAILTALDTLPLPVGAETVAHYAKKFWKGALPADAELNAQVTSALERLTESGDARSIPNRLRGNRWAITDAGRANAR